MEGGLYVRDRELNDGLCCWTEDAAGQLHRGGGGGGGGEMYFFSGLNIVAQREASDCSPSENKCTPCGNWSLLSLKLLKVDGDPYIKPGDFLFVVCS